jgi:hypothetical protein
MSRGHGMIERKILRHLPETYKITTRRLQVRVYGVGDRYGGDLSRLKNWRTFRSSFNRALLNLERSNKIVRTEIIAEGEKIRAWQNPEMMKLRRILAYHEAGHAVIGMILDCGVESATIKPARASLGSVDVDQLHAIKHENKILFSLAGLVAECEFTGEPCDWKADKMKYDMRSVGHSRNQLRLNAREVKERDEYEAATRKLVRKHWRQIGAVAAALLKRETLSRIELRALSRPKN